MIHTELFLAFDGAREVSSSVRQAGLSELITRAIAYNRGFNVVLLEVKTQVKSRHSRADDANALFHRSCSNRMLSPPKMLATY